MIRFLLNRTPVELSSVAPDMTVLDYLRNEENRKGTKEGCASGDCGACTIVVGELIEQAGQTRLRYRTLNSCITFLPSLHGKQLLTVEDLATEDALHPVQQALVDNHGSQCGYCTPGFVMSMFALYHTDGQYNRTELDQALSGNLCRCTGYRPIVDAGMAFAAQERRDQFHQAENEIIGALQALQSPNNTVELHGEGKSWWAPRTLQQLTELYSAHPDARLVAGSTDLGLEVSQMFKSLPKMISTAAVAELQTIEVSADELNVGAAVTYTDLNPVFEEKIPAFAYLVNRIGAVPIRNQGTLGGNVGNASPIGDTPPVLLALDAEVTLRKGAQQRRLPLHEFFLDYRKTAMTPSELIETIHIPLQHAQALKVYKISKRIDDDISAVLAAICIETDAANKISYCRLGYGGMAAIPKRAEKTEQFLLGKELTSDSIAQAKAILATELTPISDVRASASYRTQVAGNLLERYFLEQTQGQTLRVDVEDEQHQGGYYHA